MGQKNDIMKFFYRAFIKTLRVLTLEHDERKKFKADLQVSKKPVRFFSFPLKCQFAQCQSEFDPNLPQFS